MTPVYFKNWISGWHWGVRAAIFLVMLSGLAQLGMFVMTQNYIVAYMGAQPEDISFAVMSTYAGIITFIPLQFRFFRYFETRSFLLINMMLSILLNYCCLHCHDITLFLVIRFFQGILASNIIVFMLLLIFSRVHPERVQIVAPAVFYGTLLSNTVIVGLLAGVVVESADWKVTYQYIILFQVILLVIILLMLKRSSGFRPYPLFQIDWAGMVIFAGTLLAAAYTFIYGSKYYWFADAKICYSSIATLVGACLFLYRQCTAKRPVIHPGIFRSRNFVTGICLLAIYYGSKDTINLIYNYAGSVLKWSALQVIGLALCNMAGMLLVLVLAIRLLLAKKVSLKPLLVAGFALTGLFNLWMYFVITPDLSFTDLLLPVLLQGVGSGLLFVPLMLFILSAAPAHTGISGLLVAALTRFTTSLNSSAGFYNLQLYYNQKFKEGFLNYLTPENQNMVDRLDLYKKLYSSKGFSNDQTLALATSGVWQNLNQQSQLLTNRELFVTFAIVLISVAILMAVLPAIGKALAYWKRRINPGLTHQQQ
jgi:DHA2 family multidrug resistance protein